VDLSALCLFSYHLLCWFVVFDRFLKACYSVLKGINQAAGVAAVANHGLGSRRGAQKQEGAYSATWPPFTIGVYWICYNNGALVN
jgi:hypothetical protein